MTHPVTEDELIKKTLETSAKTIAMVGVSSIKKEISTNIREEAINYCNEIYARIWL